MNTDIKTAKEKLQLMLKKNKTGGDSEPELVRGSAREGGLSFGQQRLWFINNYIGPNPVYNMHLALRLQGVVDECALQESVEAIVKRQASLRTRFQQTKNEVQQVIEQEVPLLSIEKVKNSSAVEVIHREEKYYPFDLGSDQLCRLRLLKDEEGGAYVVLLTLHHSVGDGVSLGIFLSELVAHYGAFVKGLPSPLTELPIQYIDYARWQREKMQGNSFGRQLEFWRRQFDGVPPLLELPTDRPRPKIQTYEGGSLPIHLPRELSAPLESLTRDHGVTMFMCLLAAFSILLQRYSGQRCFTIGIPVASRDREEIERIIGFFANTLVIRFDVDEQLNFGQYLARVRETVLQSYAHQDLPFERLVEEINPERNQAYSPLFQVAFALQNLHDESARLPDLDIVPLVFDNDSQVADREYSHFDLMLSLHESDDRGIVGRVSYNTGLFAQSTIERLREHFICLLTDIVARPEVNIGELNLLTPPEQSALVCYGPDTDAQAQASACQLSNGTSPQVSEAIALQARQRPDAIAVIDGPLQLSYRELSDRVDKLAAFIQTRQLGPERLVGFSATRGVSAVLAMLAIIRSGAAYVPLDPATPPDRLAYFIRCAELPLIFTDEASAEPVATIVERLPASSLKPDIVSVSKAIRSDEQWQGSFHQPASVDQLIYVIFTSGSTGRPKASGVTHGGIRNLVDWYINCVGMTAYDRVLVASSINFDLTQKNILATLSVGASVYLAAEPFDPTSIAQSIQYRGISLTNMAPSAFHSLIHPLEKLRRPMKHLRHIVLGGEPINLPLMSRLFQWHPHLKVINSYGPTECSDVVTAYRFDHTHAENMDFVPIGRAIPGLRSYVLRGAAQAVPRGAVGELCLGGVGVSRGYLGNPRQTAEKFVPNRFAASPGERLYRTGDLVKELKSGDLTYVGRTDDQVKMRGFRIELSEITNTLKHSKGVNDAAVLVNKVESREKLVAYASVDKQYAPACYRALQKKHKVSNPSLVSVTLPNGMDLYTLNQAETDFLYNEIFVDQCYEQHGISIRDGDCIFDVGANIGFFSVYLATRYRGLSVFSFEPIQTIFELLQANCHLYGDNNLSPCHVGLSEKPGRDRFEFYPHHSIVSGQSSDDEAVVNAVRKYLEFGLESEGQSVEGASERLEELIRERLLKESVEVRLSTVSEQIRQHNIQAIQLLKIDVERHEFSVLLGIEDEHWDMIQQVILEVHDEDGALARVQDLLEKQQFLVHCTQEESMRNNDIYMVYARRPVVARPEAPAMTAPADDRIWLGVGAFRAALREQLKDVLPDYMLPESVVLLDELPLSTNGKINRQALPAPQPGDYEHSEFVAPSTETEKQICEIWSALLQRQAESIGAKDSFFKLGGHSLLAMQFLQQTESKFGVSIAVKTLFGSPTLQEISSLIDYLVDSSPGMGNQSTMEELLIL
ncbi:amino acid adenylation domain-containing protein [Microbulbifer sp. TYP-18]|uniref:amino acid adenylation domain-containing protein n=1 Tax=Microbulbifer sp. TYP-18 TaxID=3230024 RepID=UPI0034C68BB2